MLTFSDCEYRFATVRSCQKPRVTQFGDIRTRYRAFRRVGVRDKSRSVSGVCAHMDTTFWLVALPLEGGSAENTWNTLQQKTSRGRVPFQRQEPVSLHMLE